MQTELEFIKSLYLPYNKVKNGTEIPDFSNTIRDDAEITFNNWTHNRQETLSFIDAFCKKMKSIHVEIQEVTCLNESKSIYVILSNWELELLAMPGVKEVCPMMEIITLKEGRIVKATGVMHTVGTLSGLLQSDNLD
jgi:DNA-directed RNA polymerase subunit H (RpoH/RPB5)